MPLVKQKLVNELRDIFREGTENAYKKTMEIDFSDDPETVKNETAKAFGDEFAKMSDKIANALTNWLKDATINTIVTNTDGSAGTGKGTIS